MVNERRIVPPQGGSALSHEHQYQVVVEDTVIVRWCTTCGKTWIIVRYAQSGEFAHQWKEIKEKDEQ